MKPTLVIAGPGSGKTHNLVDQIVKCISTLEPHRVLAAITYTNAATNSIKGKLEKKIKIPPNVFIGTTYSFFNTFILLPYASLFGLADMDKMFIEFDVLEKAKEITDARNIRDRGERAKYQRAVQSNILKGLLAKGIIPFDEISKISDTLMENKRIRFLVGNKIQYLFIDEFQDATTQQYKIFDQLRKEKRTNIYSVGDPEQYISNHTIRGRAIPHFTKIPIMTFQKSCEVETHSDNHRSSQQVVDFINNFNTQIVQTSTLGHTPDSNVYFISSTGLEDIVKKFQDVTKPVEKIPNFIRFYLSFANSTFDRISQKYGLTRVANDHIKPKSKLSECLKIISSSTGLSIKKLCLEYCLEPIQLRLCGIKLLRGDFPSSGDLKNFLSQNLKWKLNPDADFEKLYEQLQALSAAASPKNSELTSSIHKSKGLEANAVLVVAKTNNELAKWLQTDRDARFSDKTDKLRLGFVAFSRAKQILCIACMQTINQENLKKLTSFNVTF